MPTTIMTEVYTLDELVQRGDEKAVARALEWVGEAFDDIAVESVSEYLADALEAANLSGLTIAGWDYWHGSVDIEGDVTAHELSRIPPGHFLGGVTFPRVELVERVCFATRRARDYGHKVWVDMAEGAPFGWSDDAYVELIADATDWQRRIEHRLSRQMREWYEGETSREYLTELADANGYTFTADGKRFG